MLLLLDIRPASPFWMSRTQRADNILWPRIEHWLLWEPGESSGGSRHLLYTLLHLHLTVSHSLPLIGTGRWSLEATGMPRAHTLCTFDIPNFKLLLGLSGSL